MLRSRAHTIPRCPTHERCCARARTHSHTIPRCPTHFIFSRRTCHRIIAGPGQAGLDADHLRSPCRPVSLAERLGEARPISCSSPSLASPARHRHRPLARIACSSLADLLGEARGVAALGLEIGPDVLHRHLHRLIICIIYIYTERERGRERIFLIVTATALRYRPFAVVGSG